LTGSFLGIGDGSLSAEVEVVSGAEPEKQYDRDEWNGDAGTSDKQGSCFQFAAGEQQQNAD
jgi:hypothetical protein